MMARTTSGTKRTDTLNTGVVVKDAGEDIGHGDEGVDEGSTSEDWGVNRSNGRSYILGPDTNQDPGGNIDKKSGTIWPIDNTMAHHHTFLIVQSDLGDYEDNGLSSSRFVSDIYF